MQSGNVQFVNIIPEFEEKNGLFRFFRISVFAAVLCRSQSAVALENFYEVGSIKKSGFLSNFINGFSCRFKFVTGAFDPAAADVFRDADADFLAEKFAEIVRLIT